jgi:hypothetical protein
MKPREREMVLPYYMSTVDHVRKIRDRKQRTDIGKYSFVNRTVKNWNELPAEALLTFPSKPKIFRELGKQLQTGRSERNRSVAKIV